LCYFCFLTQNIGFTTCKIHGVVLFGKLRHNFLALEFRFLEIGVSTVKILT
jgi:hypothetical protein